MNYFVAEKQEQQQQHTKKQTTLNVYPGSRSQKIKIIMKHKTITQQAAASTRLFLFLFGEQAFQCLLCVVVLCYSCVYDSGNNKIKSQTKIFKLCIVLQYLEYGFQFLSSFFSVFFCYCSCYVVVYLKIPFPSLLLLLLLLLWCILLFFIIF